MSRKRPRLTQTVVDGLLHMSADALVALDELEGFDKSPAHADDLRRASEYVTELAAWFNERRQARGVPDRVSPILEQPSSHNPACVFREGHEGECVTHDDPLISDLVDPASANARRWMRQKAGR